MDPNSSNQLWSRWTWTVTPSSRRLRPFEEVRVNVARFAKKAFGSATQMNLVQRGEVWTIDVRTEGHPAHDPQYQSFMLTNFHRFFMVGFGVDSVIRSSVKLEAGSKQDGKPADQLLIMPTIRLFG